MQHARPHSAKLLANQIPVFSARTSLELWTLRVRCFWSFVKTEAQNQNSRKSKTPTNVHWALASPWNFLTSRCCRNCAGLWDRLLPKEHCLGLPVRTLQNKLQHEHEEKSPCRGLSDVRNSGQIGACGGMCVALMDLYVRCTHMQNHICNSDTLRTRPNRKSMDRKTVNSNRLLAETLPWHHKVAMPSLQHLTASLGLSLSGRSSDRSSSIQWRTCQTKGEGASSCGT